MFITRVLREHSSRSRSTRPAHAARPPARPFPTWDSKRAHTPARRAWGGQGVQNGTHTHTQPQEKRGGTGLVLLVPVTTIRTRGERRRLLSNKRGARVKRNGNQHCRCGASYSRKRREAGHSWDSSSSSRRQSAACPTADDGRQKREKKSSRSGCLRSLICRNHV